jgi:hypothetical protein
VGDVYPSIKVAAVQAAFGPQFLPGAQPAALQGERPSGLLEKPDEP